MKFWEWVNAAIDHANLWGSLHTVFGWTLHTGPKTNARTLANFPMQANGAEMLRLACIYATEGGIQVCAPVHDAILIEAPLPDLDETVSRTQKLMAKASEDVLGGFQLRSDAHVIRYPDRYMDQRGQRMWYTVKEILEGFSVPNRPIGPAIEVSHDGAVTCPMMGHPSSLMSSIYR